MYTEFIIIFSGLGVIIVLLLVVIVLLIVLMKKSSNDIPVSGFVSSASISAGQPQASLGMAATSSVGSGVVFCKNCFTEFDASVRFCPKCGTPQNK